MKKILTILFLSLSLFCKSQINDAWFNSYGGSIPTVESITTDLAADYAFYEYARLLSDGGSTITEFGTLFGTSPNLTYGSSYSTTGTLEYYGSELVMRTYISNYPTPFPANTYYFRPYAINVNGIGYGEYQYYIVTVESTNPPTVIINNITSITESTATINATVTDDGGSYIVSHAVYYRKIDIGTYTKINTTSLATSFSETLTGLQPNSTYYVYVSATNSSGIGFSSVSSFTTSGGSGTPPTVTTNSITSITSDTATGGGNVTNQGSSAVSMRGVCWNTAENPTIADSHTTDGAGTGVFSSNINGLSCITTYYVKAYAINSSGISYGSQVQFVAMNYDNPTVTFDYMVSVIDKNNVTYNGYSQSNAQTMCSIYCSSNYLTGNLSSFKLDSYSVGGRAFTSSGTCRYYVTGYLLKYISVPGAGKYTDIVQFSNGVIQSITSCP